MNTPLADIMAAVAAAQKQEQAASAVIPAIAIGGVGVVTVPWATAFTGTYLAFGQIVGPAGLTLLRLGQITAQTPTSVTFQVFNIGISALTASAASVNALGRAV